MSTNPNVSADLSSLLEELKKRYELTRNLCWRDYEVESGIIRYIKELYPGVFIHIGKTRVFPADVAPWKITLNGDWITDSIYRHGCEVYEVVGEAVSERVKISGFNKIHLKEGPAPLRLEAPNLLDVEEANLFVRHTEFAIELIKHALSITVGAAQVLVQSEHDRYSDINLSFDSLSSITPEVCRILARHRSPILLNSLTNICSEVAEALSGRWGNVELNGLKQLTTECAIHLGKISGEIALNGLEDLSLDVARGLTSNGWNRLTLNGLKNVSMELLSTLGAGTRCVHLGGVMTIDTSCAKLLATFSKVTIGFNHEEILPTKIGIKDAVRFLNNRENIDFCASKWISCDAAETLRDFDDLFAPLGIPSLAEAASAARDQNKEGFALTIRERASLSSPTIPTGAGTIKHANFFRPIRDRDSENPFLLEQIEESVCEDNFDYFDIEDNTDRSPTASEMTEDSDDYARSDEDGWFYHDE